MKAKQTLIKLLKIADVRVGGDRPGDIVVHNPKFYQRVLAEGSLGLGESYMDGWWDCDHLDVFFAKVIKSKIEEEVKGWVYIIDGLKARFFNMQSKIRSHRVAKEHYDLGNDMYSPMLGKTMQYTCAYWKGLKRVPANLDKAQEQKLDLVCRKMGLKKGMKVLELGGGWGGFAKYAAEKYGVSVTSYNISKEQVEFGRQRCKGLPVEIIQKDYREAKGKFDRVVSIGLCEHIGHKNHRDLMKLVNRCLKPEGLFLLHTIGNRNSKPTVEPWLQRYIFPGGDLPSLKQLATAAEGLLVIEDFHAFGHDYDDTCFAWDHNFVKNWDKIKDIKKPNGKPKYNERFYRMWRYYLLQCSGSFRVRGYLWQLVLSKGRVKDYIAVR